MTVLGKLLGNVKWTTFTGQLHVGIDCVVQPRVLSLVDDVNFSLKESCRLPARPDGVVQLLEPLRHAIADVVVLAKADGYDLVDALMAARYPVNLVTPAQLQRFAGLKNSDDWHDAYWLAHLLRARALPDGNLYESEGVRDTYHYPRPDRDRFRPLTGRLRLRRRRVVPLGGGRQKP